MRVAAALFERSGFAGVTMAAVARGARISKTTLYTRYPDKAALFRAICSYACRVPAERFAAVATQGRPPREVLPSFAKAIITATRDPDADRFLRLAIFEAPRFPDLAKQILEESRAVTAPLARYLTGLSSPARADETEMLALAEQFVTLVTGGHAWLLRPELPDEVAERTAMAVTLTLSAIGIEGRS